VEIGRLEIGDREIGEGNLVGIQSRFSRDLVEIVVRCAFFVARCALSVIQGGLDGEGAGVHDVGVDHGGAHVFVAQEFLDGADAVAGFEEVGGEGVAEDVGRDAFGHVCTPGRLPHGFLEAAFIGVMAPHSARSGIDREAGGGKDVLPAPFAGGVGVFAGQGVGQENVAATFCQIVLVHFFDHQQMCTERLDQLLGEDGDAICGSLAIADNDLVLGEVDIFNAQTHAFHETQSTAVEELGHEQVDARHLAEHGVNFISGQDGGQALGLFGLGGAKGVGNGLVEDFVVEEEKGAAGLVLGGGGDVFIDGEMGEEGFDFGRAQIGGMTETAIPGFMKREIAFNPADICLFGAIRVVFAADGVAHKIEKFWFLGGGRA